MIKQWLFRLFLAILIFVNVGAAIQAFQYVSVLAYEQGYQPELTIPLPVVGSAHILMALSCLVILLTQWATKHKRVIYIWSVAYQLVYWVLYVLGDISAYARDLWTRKAAYTLLFFLVIVWLIHIRTRKKKKSNDDAV